ncbi:Alpha-amylase A type-1/2 [Entophlyctis luteolus]|nr:Alpha-amylase A type-1/2 [Entophlyctis luteolus]KAJ3349972.1 Alpha-amylase A type-1/2 [Entophlyctis luteolus]
MQGLIIVLTGVVWAVGVVASTQVYLATSSFNLVSGAFNGTISVLNIAYTKTVIVYYSSPSGTWSSANAIHATYAAASTNNYETWTYSTTTAISTALGAGSQYYIAYTVSGSTYYDNNNSGNYIVAGVWSYTPYASVPTDGAQLRVNSIKLSENGTTVLSGVLWVENISYTKVVQVCFSAASSSTSTCVAASYQAAASGVYETWGFSVTSSAIGIGSSVSFTYTVSGSAYSDGPYVLGVSSLPSVTSSSTSSLLASNTATISTSTAATSISSTTTSATFASTAQTTNATASTASVTTAIVSTVTATALTTTATSTTATPTVLSFVPHPEGPANTVPALVRTYSFETSSKTLNGTIWVRSDDVAVSSAFAVGVYYSDSNGIFLSSSPYVSASLNSSITSEYAGYNIWSFSSVISSGGIGMHFYLRSGTASNGTYATNGGDWYHYRVFPPRRTFQNSQWLGRSIYQLLTDRFARPLSSPLGPYDNCTTGYSSSFCGGTWQGVVERLAYISNMGFDAIWISPIVNNTSTGYHGYYAWDFNTLSPQFGGATALSALIAAAHSQNLAVMFDMVTNHVGISGTGYLTYYAPPINTDAAYHSYCVIDYSVFNQTDFEYCRINSVNPDLNTENSTVVNYLTSSYQSLFSSYPPDGLRIDTFRHVPRAFWTSFLSALGNPFAIGEIDSSNTSYVASYQPLVPSVLNYPFYYNAIQPVFGSKSSMTLITSQLALRSSYSNYSNLGVFADNHDQSRILAITGGDTALVRNALVLTLFTDGIPIVYQGTEQGYTDDSDTRLPLWTTKFSTLPSLGFYQFLQIMLRARRDVGLDALISSQHNPLYTTATVHVFSRGPFLVALTNTGSSSGTSTNYTIPTSTLFSGKTLRNVLIPSDTIAPDSAGNYYITFLNGEPKVYN